MGNIISEVAPYLGIETDPALLPTGNVTVPNLVNPTNPSYQQWDMAQVELNKKGIIAADETSYRTSMEGVFAVGDATNQGASIAIEDLPLRPRRVS